MGRVVGSAVAEWSIVRVAWFNPLRFLRRGGTEARSSGVSKVCCLCCVPRPPRTLWSLSA